MTPKLMIFLAIGTLLMAAPIFAVSASYTVSKWKAALITVFLTVVGTLGTFLMFYIENHATGGLSFYGAVFLVPLVFLLIAKVLWVPYGKIMDLCAIGECIMLALMKVHCLISGCCIGRILVAGDGVEIRFPSRTAELLVALVLFVILLRWARKGQNRERLYPMYLLMYGTSRFFLNILREAWVVKEMLLPFGNIWSLVAIGISLLWLYRLKKTVKHKEVCGE